MDSTYAWRFSSEERCALFPPHFCFVDFVNVLEVDIPGNVKTVFISRLSELFGVTLEVYFAKKSSHRLCTSPKTDKRRLKTRNIRLSDSIIDRSSKVLVLMKTCGTEMTCEVGIQGKTAC